MIEDLLGDATWPLAAVVIAALLALTVVSVHNDNSDTKFKVACVQAGGTVGFHDGDPTCSGAR